MQEAKKPNKKNNATQTLTLPFLIPDEQKKLT